LGEERVAAVAADELDGRVVPLQRGGDVEHDDVTVRGEALCDHSADAVGSVGWSASCAANEVVLWTRVGR
jgi:hypothetical protein